MSLRWRFQPPCGRHDVTLPQTGDLITQSRRRAYAILQHHDLIHKPVTKRVKTNRLPLVLTYNLTNPDVIGLITKFWPILQTSVKGAILFKDPPVRAFRQSPNLLDHLVNAALKSNVPRTTPYPKQSGKKRDCPTCKLIKRRDKLPQNNREYKLAKDINCQTNNVVYLLECTRCKKLYVGARQSETSSHDLRPGMGVQIWKKINNGCRLLMSYMMEGFKKVNLKNGILWLFSVTDPLKSKMATIFRRKTGWLGNATTQLLIMIAIKLKQF